eukprot:455049-Hanusia_phi.AAC.2
MAVEEGRTGASPSNSSDPDRPLTKSCVGSKLEPGFDLAAGDDVSEGDGVGLRDHPPRGVMHPLLGHLVHLQQERMS